MLCLFEDELAANFNPLAATRHLAYLRVGARTLRERAVAATGDREVTLHGRAYIRAYHGAMGDRVDAPEVSTLFLNARVPMSTSLADRFPNDGEWILRSGGSVIAARLDPASIARLDWSADALDFSALDGIARHETESVDIYTYIWDLIYDNGARIVEDADMEPMALHGEVMSGAHLVARESILLGAGSIVKPGAVIDASGGPVLIGRGVEVMSNAVIEGPCTIGDGVRIKIGAKIYEQTSIGPRCKVGGEVESSILLGYSNKQHDGFLGHSYIGEWVNLGADTNTSDLKNNYGTIRAQLNGREIDTGRMFLGALIGDHAKTGINTMINTGTVIGVAANVFGGGFPPKSIPAFAWGGSEGFETYRLDRAIEVARIVMARRDVPLTPADETLLHLLFESK